MSSIGYRAAVPASVSAVQYACPGSGKPNTVSWRRVAQPTKRYHSRSSPALGRPNELSQSAPAGLYETWSMKRAVPGTVICTPRW